MQQADQARADFAAIEDDLDFIKGQLARIPTRKEQARNTLGIILTTAMLMTIAVLWFAEYWSLLPVTRAGPLIVLMMVAVVSSPAAAREHRSREVAREFQRAYPCPSIGKTSGACPGYRKDHIVLLGCGGPPRFQISNGRRPPRRKQRTAGSVRRAAVSH